MKTTRSRKEKWPRKIIVGRVHVTIYKRTMPNGEPGFLVANYASVVHEHLPRACEPHMISLASRGFARICSGHYNSLPVDILQFQQTALRLVGRDSSGA